MAGVAGYRAGHGPDRGPQKTDDRAWSSYIPSSIKNLLPGGRGKEMPHEHGILIQAQPKTTQREIDQDWENVQIPKDKDELETLRHYHTESLLKIADLEQRVQIAEQSAQLKENAITDLIKQQKQKSGRKKSKGKHDVDGAGAQLVAKIDDFQKIEEKFKLDLQQKEEQRYQATQQVIALREELSSSRHHIENLQYRYQEMVDVNQKMEGEMKQLLEIVPEDIPEDVDVKVLVSQLRARVSTLEKENQQVKEHTKQQSKHIQIMKQHEEGIEFHKGDLESLKSTCEDLKRHNKAQADQLRKMKEENQQLLCQVEAKQAQAVTYKLDFDEERKDRAEAHSQYADLEKKMAELKKEHIQEISQITKDLELHKDSLGDVEGVKFALDKELRDWQAEALQSRDELQAKTSQVKAYKKQVDQLKKKSELQEQQLTKLTENLTLLSEELSTVKKSLQKKSDLLQAQEKKGKRNTTEPKKKSTGEPPSPCGGLEQQLANAEKLCDTLQTENESLQGDKKALQLAEKRLKNTNDELTDKVKNLDRNLRDLKAFIKREQQVSEASSKGKLDKTHSAVHNSHFEDPKMSALPQTNNTLMATPLSYPPSVQPSSMPSQFHTTSYDISEQGPRSDGFGENSQSNDAQFQQLHVQGNVRNFDEQVYRDGNNYGQSYSPVASRGANDPVVPHHLPNTTVNPQSNYRDHNLAPQQQYNQGTHYPSNYCEPQQYSQQRQPDYQQRQWHSQNQQQYYDGQQSDVYSQQRQDQYHSQDPQQQMWRSQGRQQYYEDQQPNVYNRQQQSQYEQSNAQSARRNLPIDLQGAHHSQRPISHEHYENTPTPGTPVTPENASTYSSYGSAQTSSDIGVDVPSPTTQEKPRPKPRMLNPARQVERKQNTPSPTYVAPNPAPVEYPLANRTELLVKPNVLQEGINGEISEAADAVSQVTREEGEREGAPLDPNLICPMCMKQYRIGEIQLYRAHVNKCDGNKQ